MGVVVQALGATPVSLSSAEQFIALQRGTIDGLIYPIYSLKAYEYYEVVNYLIKPYLYDPGASDMLMGEKAWQKLSPAQQAAFERASIDTMHYSIIYSSTQDYDAAEFMRKKGVNIVELSPEEEKRFKDAVAPIFAEHAKKSESCAKQVELIQNFIKSTKNKKK